MLFKLMIINTVIILVISLGIFWYIRKSLTRKTEYITATTKKIIECVQGIVFYEHHLADEKLTYPKSSYRELVYMLDAILGDLDYNKLRIKEIDRRYKYLKSHENLIRSFSLYETDLKDFLIDHYTKVNFGDKMYAYTMLFCPYYEIQNIENETGSFKEAVGNLEVISSAWKYTKQEMNL